MSISKHRICGLVFVVEFFKLGPSETRFQCSHAPPGHSTNRTNCPHPRGGVARTNPTIVRGLFDRYNRGRNTHFTALVARDEFQLSKKRSLQTDVLQFTRRILFRLSQSEVLHLWT